MREAKVSFVRPRSGLLLLRYSPEWWSKLRC